MPPISDRLRSVMQERCQLGPFSDDELEVVAVWGSGGMVRMPAVDTLTPERRQVALERLAGAGYLRAGPPDADEPERDQVAATIGPDLEPVTLLGDYAIVMALRSSPGALADLRTMRGRDLVHVSNLFAGVKPAVVLQEFPVGDDRHGFFLYRAEHALVSLLRACGVRDDEFERPSTPPSVGERSGPEAQASWNEWTDLRIARPVGGEVKLTTMLVGRDGDGLWVLEPPYDSGVARWTATDDFGQRVAGLLRPPEDALSWLVRAPAAESGR